MKRLIALGAAAAAIAGCGSTKYVTQTQTSSTTETETVTTTRNVVHVRRLSSIPPVTTTQTTTRTVITAPQPTSSFSGNGGENLGTLHIATDSTIHWTDDGGLFAFTDSGDGIFVNSQGSNGVSQVSAGTYHGVSVNAAGNWTIQIVPNS
jgi:hypothetical protein